MPNFELAVLYELSSQELFTSNAALFKALKSKVSRIFAARRVVLEISGREVFHWGLASNVLLWGTFYQVLMRFMRRRLARSRNWDVSGWRRSSRSRTLSCVCWTSIVGNWNGGCTLLKRTKSWFRPIPVFEK